MTASTFEILSGCIVAVIALLKGRALVNFFQAVVSANGRSIVNSAAGDVVELLRTEVGELRTQLSEERARNEALAQKVIELNARIQFLVDEVRGESPIKQLTQHMDTFAEALTQGVNALLEKEGLNGIKYGR